MNASERLAAHEQFMRAHHRTIAADLVPDLEKVGLEAAYRELPESDRDAIAVALNVFQRIANDES